MERRETSTSTDLVGKECLDCGQMYGPGVPACDCTEAGHSLVDIQAECWLPVNEQEVEVQHAPPDTDPASDRYVHQSDRCA